MALPIVEQQGNKPVIAYLYHELARAARDQGRFDDAEIWSSKALAVAEDLEDSQ